MSRGLFVDLDGTLCDSLPALREAYATFLTGFERVGSDAEFAGLNGATLSGVVAELRASHGLAAGRAELEACYAGEIARARGVSSPIEGARQLLEAARRWGWRVAVVTSGSRSGAQGWLETHGLVASVDLVVGGDDVVASKPAPDGYLRALNAVGCRAEESIGVEDSPAGLRAASAAGLEVFHFAPLPCVLASPLEGWAAGEGTASPTRIAKLAELVPRLERVGRTG